MIRNALIIELVAGDRTDPELLGFTYNITSWTSTRINFKFIFDNPFEISQSEPVETVRVKLNM